MWYLETKSLTPFDERYLRVPFEFMEYSYQRYMSQHSYEDIRTYLIKTKIQEEKKRQIEEEISKTKPIAEEQLSENYDSETVKKIMDAMIQQAAQE